MLPCPSCKSTDQVHRKGFYERPSDRKKIQRYRCKACGVQYSEQRASIDYRLRKREIDQPVFRLLSKGMSQRAIALVLGVKPAAIARRVVRFGRIAAVHLEAYRASRPPASEVMMDEMESFEHTKLKPLTMPLAVEARTRKILGLGVGSIAAKGPLAELSRKKYGPRECQRGVLLDRLLEELSRCTTPNVVIKTDESCHYGRRIKKHLPKASHQRFKGRRGCVVGQGELKRGGFDPLFSLNHTCAMYRDNLKRLSRRTWCTTKRPDRLELLMQLYAYFHNERLEGIKMVTLRPSPIPI